MQVGLQVVVAGQVHGLAALLVQPHPEAAVLHVHVLDWHSGGRANPGEGVDHQANQRLVAQADRRRGVDRVEDGPSLAGGEDRRLAALHHVFRPADCGGGIERQHAAGGEPVEQHPDRGKVLLDGGSSVPAAQILDVGGDVDRADGRD